MSIKDGSCSIMSENHSNLQANIRENLTEGELAIMDEVEFTPLPVSSSSTSSLSVCYHYPSRVEYFVF